MAASQVAILGLGRLPSSREPSDVSLGQLARQVSREAIADAGLEVSDIDGVSVYVEPGYPESADGRLTITPQYLWRTMGLDLSWGEANTKYVGSSLIEAHNAIAGGACRFALVIRAVDRVTERSAPSELRRVSAADPYLSPYGAHLPFVDYAIATRRYFAQYGAGREDLGRFVVRNREHALADPDSYWSNNGASTLDLEQYLAARMIADPLCLYDCDIPVRSCMAFVLGPADAAAGRGAAEIAGFAQNWASPQGAAPFAHAGGRKPVPLVESAAGLRDYYQQRLWRSTGLTPGDMGSAQLYDGFSILTWLWLETLGFAGAGEGFALAQDEATSMRGRLPLNTAGGHLGAGAVAGAPHYYEAALQAMGRAGARQTDAEHVIAATDRPDRGQVLILRSRR